MTTPRCVSPFLIGSNSRRNHHDTKTHRSSRGEPLRVSLRVSVPSWLRWTAGAPALMVALSLGTFTGCSVGPDYVEPELPVMPGVIQVEALAQTMAVYVAREKGFGERIGLFAGIDECRFKRIVQPGDRITLEVTMEKLGRRFGRGRAVASVDGEVCCEARISFVIPPAEALR